MYETAVGPGPAGAALARGQSVGDSALAELLRRWWLAVRPGWVDPGWYDAPLRPAVRALVGLPLGLELLSALADLGVGPCPGDHVGEGAPGQPRPGRATGFPCACQVVIAGAWEAMASWTAARSAEALVAAVGSTPIVIAPAGAAPGITDPAREELAPALRLSPTSVALRIQAARNLAHHPELVALVTDGVCSIWAARNVLGETVNLPDEAAADVIRSTVAACRERNASGRRPWTATEVRRTARVARLRVAQPADDAARTHAHAARRVSVHPAGDGMAALVAILAESDAHRILARLTALARGLDDADNQRTADQKRADLLTDVLLASGPSPDAGSTSAHRSDISIVVSLNTLLRLDDLPAEATGIGPIPARVARELAADGVWRAWITDENGQITATSSRGYTPSPALARLIRAREPHCRMPGCRTRAANCDLDHTVPYPAGATAPTNLGPLCRRHHILKTHYRHDLANDDPTHDDPANDDPANNAGGWTWTTPAGITHRDVP